MNGRLKIKNHACRLNSGSLMEAYRMSKGVKKRKDLPFVQDQDKELIGCHRLIRPA